MHAELLFGTAAMCTFVVAVAYLIALPFGLWFQRGIAENKSIAAAWRGHGARWDRLKAKSGGGGGWLAEVKRNEKRRGKRG